MSNIVNNKIVFKIMIIANTFNNSLKVVGCKFVVSSLLVLVIFISNFSTNYRHDYDWGSRYANTVLNSLPKDSVLILDDDISVGTIGYTRLVENVRPDVMLLTNKALVFRDRLFDHWVD